ncbi:aldose 1-epimerase, partial [Mycobacterium ulcerans]|uniref:aldose 1-epimerase n=1 Tax=Mycobacterium ulcerans TaxID=1809 RepID=UPI002AAF1D82
NSNQLDRSPDSPCLHSGPNSAAPKIINPAHKPANQQRRSPGVDPAGLPIHGVLAAYPGWRVTAQSGNELTAELDFGADPVLLASFLYPHVLSLTARLAERVLTLRTTVTPTGDTAVPLCFGFHPYLQLPGVPRTEWVIETPPLRQLCLDQRGLPTGESDHRPAKTAPLGEGTFDDGYDQVTEGAVFAASGGGRRLEVHFEQGYPAAQIFAPIAEDVICFEPMAAPTDALRRGGYRCAPIGESAIAVFSIHV